MLPAKLLDSFLQSNKSNINQNQVFDVLWGVCVCVCVCVALFYYTDIGESSCTVPKLHREWARGDAPTIRDRPRPNLTLSPSDKNNFSECLAPNQFELIH